MGIPWRGISDNLYSGFAGFSLAISVTRILNLGHQLRFWDSLRRHAIDGDLVLACPHLRGVRLINGTPGGSVSAQAAEGVLGVVGPRHRGVGRTTSWQQKLPPGEVI